MNICYFHVMFELDEKKFNLNFNDGKFSNNFRNVENI